MEFCLIHLFVTGLMIDIVFLFT
ncbi:hypothetical protein [Thermaerobacillus caldiproteolyticus]|nr:hypothetical protein [Anoxybacillus caldiproteolyticus]